jgi:hypothetical protein
MPDFKRDTIEFLRKMTPEELANYTANSPPGNWMHLAGVAEFTLRQTQWQMKAVPRRRSLHHCAYSDSHYRRSLRENRAANISYFILSKKSESLKCMLA